MFIVCFTHDVTTKPLKANKCLRTAVITRKKKWAALGNIVGRKANTVRFFANSQAIGFAINQQEP